MQVVEASAVIPLGPEETWDLLFGDQARRAVEALDNVIAVEDFQMRADGTPRYTMVRKVGPLTMSTISDYSVFEHPYRTVSHTRDPNAPFGGTFYTTHEPVAGGTRLTFRMEMVPQNSLAAVMLPVIRPLFARQLQQDVDDLANAATPQADNELDNPGIRVPPPLIYLLPLVLGLLLDRRSRVPFLPSSVARGLGWPLIGGGALLTQWFFRTMHSADAPVRTDKPVPRLTTDGPFRYTRNPGYLSLAMIYAGIAVLRNSLWAVLFLPLVVYVVQREVIGREERYLERTFGEEYRAYKARVRRWM